MTKDFKDSFKQKLWEFDIARHTRANEYLNKYDKYTSDAAEKVKQYYKAQIVEIETKYPNMFKS